MKRITFLKNLSYGLGSTLLGTTLLSCSKGTDGPTVEIPSKVLPITTKGKLRIGVITDVHKDFFPDADLYLQKFIDTAKQSNVDLIIQIGDFVYPHFKNDGFMQIWNSFEGPKYHVLGNHDMDTASKSDFLTYVNQKQLGNYYSFDSNGFHLVVMDTNYIKSGGIYTDYNAKNYTKHPANEIGYVSKEQLDWLREDLRKTDKPCIIFSHQPFNGSAGNSKEVQEILKEENKKGKKIIAAFSGHLHKNWLIDIDEVSHIQVNSASYFYVGKNHPTVTGRFPASVEANYPIMKESAPYDDSLFAIIDFDGPDREIKIQGRKSNFIAPTPYDLNYYTYVDQQSPSSNIDNRIIKF
ncbi:metallophosphoesterase family protein [Sphingobacterium paucimobilis]|uniref:Calcineurin-like phosphoesterase domain-containing protein n=1 Tax=Sphingobacterium paucimobilis HER1398 TaxID=1346330 RepID=U2J3K0_9SPHI|nr:metallophosphoesterase [Sphingobacterium paucimobilis]ERJ57218.1 hypothetical protein M472_00415 [Sphingobacterium paucimobilis HER1398]